MKVSRRLRQRLSGGPCDHSGNNIPESTLKKSADNTDRSTGVCEDIDEDDEDEPPDEFYSVNVLEDPALLASTSDILPSICYGMLFAVRFQQIRSRPAPETVTDGGGKNQQYVHLALERQDDGYFLSSQGKPRIALLNCKMAAIFASLEDEFDVCFTPYVTSSDLCSMFKPKSLVAELPALVSVNINVNGPQVSRGAVGEVLSRGRLFLQQPYWKDDGLEYDNPHLLRFHGLSTGEIEAFNLSLPACEQRRSVDGKWVTVLDDLPQHQLQHLAVNKCESLLMVPLLQHQIEANSFMLRREEGHLDERLQYWQLEASSSGQPVCVRKNTTLRIPKIDFSSYCHVVTGKQCFQRPAEPLGGILGDDMGLGKTLSAISLIVGSNERASSFADTPAVGSACSSERLRTKATLVVVPSLLVLENWEHEIKRHTKPGALKVDRYHGHHKPRFADEFLSSDIVLTTFGTIKTEHRKSWSRDVLYRLSWFRIVLDEAHIIRSQSTKQFKAIIDLQARHHWCLTGTPIINRVEDLGTLLRFCRVPLLEDPACFRETISKILKESFAHGCRLLRQTLIPLCLRRTKDILNLPKPSRVLRMVEFSRAESNLYQDIKRLSRQAIDTSKSRKNASKKRFTVLQAILQLRRMCNHGTLVKYRKTETERDLDADEALTLRQEDDGAFCAFCNDEILLVNQLEDPTSGLIGDCNHVICRSCLQSCGDLGPFGKFQCPVCKHGARQKILKPTGKAMKYRFAPLAHSSKLDALLKDLRETRHKEKSLVFSVWKRTIDIASHLCSTHELLHRRIDGTVPQAERVGALNDFINNPDISVLFMTLGTGALGLTLTAASRVHIFEPQWNPAVEEQAIGRIVRFGQANETTVIRYLVKDSVEEQIHGYQKRKVQLAADSFGDQSSKQTEAETQLLTATFLQDE